MAKKPVDQIKAKKKYYEDVKATSLKNTYEISGKLFEITENALRFTYLPLMLLSFAFAFVPVLGVLFPALLIFNYTISKVISNSFKDDFKDAGDGVNKEEDAEKIKAFIETNEKISVLNQELFDLKCQNEELGLETSNETNSNKKSSQSQNKAQQTENQQEM